MTLDEYLTKNNISNTQFALSMGESRAENVRRWRHNISTPSDRNMKKIYKLTNKQVTPNSFYEVGDYA